jgi:hypothetical protein
MFMLAALATGCHHAPAERTDDAVGDGVSDACIAPIGVPIASLVAHNTSANAAYDRAHFPANFATETWISQSGATMPIDPDRTGLSA